VEQKSKEKTGVGTVIFVTGCLLAGVVIGGIIFGDFASSPSVSTNETYLYTLGYTQGHNDALSSLPSVTQSSDLSESDVMNQIMEALGTADKVDLQIKGDKSTGNTTLSLYIEFSQPNPSADYHGEIK
jgi:hypothetical protein